MGDELVQSEISHKYKMSMSLNVLNHLGFNLYSNIPSVLSEVVANAYDADATEVNINIGEESIEITDNGHGMTVDDINNKYLFVGYQRRENNEALSPIYKRPVMGRKGIGKLSLFSIANTIEIHTTRINQKTAIKEKNGFVLKKQDIISQIQKTKDNTYYPNEIDSSNVEIENGTKIILTDFKKKISHAESYLKKRLARRFSVIGQTYKFDVNINGNPITITDRDFFKKIQMIWIIGDDENRIVDNFKFKRVNILNGKIDGTSYAIRGWIGAVEQPSDLEIDAVNNNKISIVCRGKMAQEDILDSFNEGGIYASYLIGEIHADFLDEDQEEDIATSSRQKINEEDARYLELQGHVYKILKEIQKVWTDLRKDIAVEVAVTRAEELSPVLKQWFDSLKTTTRQEHAKKLFATIESLHFDLGESDKKKELYKQGILAFEKLKLRDSLHQLDKITSAEDIRLAAVFTDLDDIEANLYFDIASERVEVIKEFQKHLDANDKEKLLQKYLFDHLWILNPSWERATSANHIMEQRVETEFGIVVNSLSPEEKQGRMDIKYRTAAGKHIIVELKRYSPSYPIDIFSLGRQAKKYRDALQKCLNTTGQAEQPIEVIIVLGEELKDITSKEVEDTLKPYNARLVYYDSLIHDSLLSYAQYLEQHKEVGKIRALIESL